MNGWRLLISRLVPALGHRSSRDRLPGAMFPQWILPQRRNVMRVPHILLVLCVLACSDKPAPVARTHSPEPARPRPPVALLGTWLRSPALDGRHDTLVLRADSSATGWIRSSDKADTVIAVARWQVSFLSRDPVAARTDVPGRYQDGGDVGCTMHPDSTCVSAPVLCLGPVGQLDCHGMTFRGDTLWLDREGRYLRVADTDTAVR